jgi:hypothetical protein
MTTGAQCDASYSEENAHEKQSLFWEKSRCVLTTIVSRNVESRRFSDPSREPGQCLGWGTWLLEW